MERVRRRVIYHGRVQGVGFRATAQAIASRHMVAGWVRNLPTGEVELVVEATESEATRFLGALAERMRQGISNIETFDEENFENLTGFSIRG